MKEYHNASAAHRPYIFSKNNQFTLVLPDLTYAAGVADSAYLRTKVLGWLVKLGYLTEDQGRPKRFTTTDDKVMLRL